MQEEAYRRVTHDYPLAVARTLARLNDARVLLRLGRRDRQHGEEPAHVGAREGRTENELLALFPTAYMFRPGFIQPTDRIESSTRRSPLFCSKAFGFLFPAAPDAASSLNLVTTTARFGRAR
mgnify:CR=1 FL=1